MTQRRKQQATNPDPWTEGSPDPVRYAGPAPSTGPAGTGPPAGAWPGDPAGTGRHAPPVTEGEPGKVHRSRFGGLWVGLVIAAVILVLLLVFILQNSQKVRVEFFGWAGHAPLAVAILLGGAAGALLVAIPGTVRILQLRRGARKR